jgi:mannosyltransferase OCH1-like enzyme
MIPKIFHLISKSKKLSSIAQSNVAAIRALYPDYEILIHDDEDILSFIKENYGEYFDRTISSMTEFIWVVDTVRYLLMDRCGGVYCDTDVFFRKRFEFDTGAIFIEREWIWPKDSSITHGVHTCLFASEPKHPVWAEILDGVAENVRAVQSPSAQAAYLTRQVLATLIGKRARPLVFNVTGPNAVSKIMTRNASLKHYKDMRVLPRYAIFEAGMSKERLEGAFFVHLAAGSWK